MRATILCFLIILVIAFPPGSSVLAQDAAGEAMDLRGKALVNGAAYIPPQCYIKTTDAAGRVHNPCFTCHQQATPPNFTNDQDLQLAYDFPADATGNHWSNLFEDRSVAAAAISDEAILAFLRTDNYHDADGEIGLLSRLADLPEGWDYDGDGVWEGYVPDCYFDFDDAGFDRNPMGQPTGWRAFAYTPLAGTFWPTNGSMDDVLIGLAEPFRRDVEGRPDRTVYALNLAIVEALIRRTDVPVDPVDERTLGVNLDGNGVLGMADRVGYYWSPQAGGHRMSYVGQAAALQLSGELHLVPGLFPEGTEFLHSVRYLDPGDDGSIALSARMKELRYARKVGWRSYSALRQSAVAESVETHAFPNRLRQVLGDMEAGVSNDQGWVYQGFIEDANGALRPQTYEETVYCVGCHGGTGAATDGILAFPRKLPADSFRRGWYDWSQRGLSGIPEPMRSDGQYEYTHYLRQNDAGDEFRANGEVVERFFDDAGRLKPARIEALHQDIAVLLYPSRQRALMLDKAYTLIVLKQRYAYGRSVAMTVPQQVYREV